MIQNNKAETSNSISIPIYACNIFVQSQMPKKLVTFKTIETIINMEKSAICMTQGCGNILRIAEGFTQNTEIIFISLSKVAC